MNDLDDVDFVMAGEDYICQFFSRRDEDFTNKMANARLIAAAPRMKAWIDFMLGSDAAPREFPNEGDAQAWYERRGEGLAILREIEAQP